MTVNWSQAASLIGAQGRLDLRHPKSGKVRSSRIFMTLVSYGFSSLILALSLRQQIPPAETVLFYSLNFGILVILFAIVSGHQSLMGYPREYTWQRVMPITESTHYVARLGNVMVYFGLIYAALIAPVVVLFAPVYSIEVLVSMSIVMLASYVWMTLIGLGLFWAMVLSSTQSWLKATTMGFQTVVILVLVTGYQWIGSTEVGVPDLPWWPANWFLDLFSGNMTPGLLITALTFPVIGGLYRYYFPRRYFNLLDRLIDAEGSAHDPAGAWTIGTPEARFIKDPQIAGAYGFSTVAFMQDSVVRDRLWPVLILPLAFAFFGWWSGSLNDLFQYSRVNIILEPATRMHPSLLVILFFSCQSLLQTVQFSLHPEAAWVFRTLPVRSPRIAQIAVLHALNWRVLLPLFTALWVLMNLSMPSHHAAIHTAYWWVTSLFVLRLQLFFHRDYPFSRKSDRFAVSERFFPLLLAVPIAILFTAIQVLVFYNVYVTTAFILTMMLINHGLITVKR